MTDFNRPLLSLGAVDGLQFRQFDIQKACPNAILKECIYMTDPGELQYGQNNIISDLIVLFMDKSKHLVNGIFWLLTLWKMLVSFKLKKVSYIFIYNKYDIQLLFALQVDYMIIGFNSGKNADWLFVRLLIYLITRII